MKGTPKHLNTKEDYLNLRKIGEWKPAWQALLDERQNWFFVKELANKTDGIEDATHKIVESRDTDEKTTFAQYEFRDDPNATIFRLGFTGEEVTAALAE